MGLYTELVIACELKPNLSQEIINMIKWWIGDIEYDPDWGQLHKKEKTAPPWCYDVLNSETPEFPGSGQIVFKLFTDESYVLSIRAGRKNYESEYEKFLNWIAPYSETVGFVGYLHYELEDLPKLIKFREGKAYLCGIKIQTEQEINVSP